VDDKEKLEAARKRVAAKRDKARAAREAGASRKRAQSAVAAVSPVLLR
jgi:hypothetical protein